MGDLRVVGNCAVGISAGGSPLLPDRVRGTINTKLYHITDFLPTIVALAGGKTNRNRPLDGYVGLN